MGTTRIKVIDLSSEKQEIKTSRKHAEKLTGAAKLKAAGPVGPLAEREEKKVKAKPATAEVAEVKPATAEITEVKTEITEKPQITETAETTEEKLKTQKEPSVPSTVARHHHQGQKYLAATALIDKNKIYPAREAIDLLYKTSITHFDPTVEVHFNVIDKNIRGSLNLPHPVSTKKKKRYLIFSEKPATAEITEEKLKGQKGSLSSASSAVARNQIIWGDQQTIADIESGKLKPNRDFDMIIAQPKFMPQLARIAKILGPAGLMPNPKNQTITENVTNALESTASASFEYKTDPSAPIVHTKLGKLSNKPEQLTENLKALVNAIGPAKIKKATLASTMSPPIKVDIASVQ